MKASDPKENLDRITSLKLPKMNVVGATLHTRIYHHLYAIIKPSLPISDIVVVVMLLF